jgi:predicted phosphohydrolase
MLYYCTMKIFAISDIHIDGKNKVSAYHLPQKMLHHYANTKDKSVLIILGDVSQNLPILHNFLKLFENLPIPKLFVAGNHDIWVTEGSNSFVKYMVVLKEAVEDAGFHYLDKEPFIYNRIGFIGNIGWYDYSFRTKTTVVPVDLKLLRKLSTKYISFDELTEKDYEEKMLMGESKGNLFVVTSWNDRHYIHWDYTDTEFTQKCQKKIKQQFEAIDSAVDRIVFASHHVHFQEGVIQKNMLQWDFNNAFVGSKSIGQYVLGQKKVDLLLFAHTHERGSYLIDKRIRGFNPAYQNAKQDFLVIDYPDT